MIRINIHDAKTNLSRYLPELERGEIIVLCKRNIPIAEIRPIPKPLQGERPIGLMAGQIHVPPSFFDPLSDAELDEYEGSIG